MAKFLVEGRDAGRAAQLTSPANNVDGAAGRDHVHAVARTRAASSRPISPSPSSTTSAYWVVASDTAHRHVETWMRRHIRTTPTPSSPTSPPATRRSTSRARARASSCSRSPRPTSRTRPSPSAPRARSTSASRARSASASRTWASSATSSTSRPSRRRTSTTASSTAGERFGLRHAGLKALASLRMEKGYRDYGHDIDNTDSVLEAGLGFAVDLKKPGGFLGQGRRRWRRRRAGPLTRRIVQVLVKDPGADALPRRGRPSRRQAGRLRPRGVVRAHPRRRGRARDGRGRRAGDAERTWTPGRWEVEIAGKLYPAVASLRPLYDAENARIKS